MPRGPRIAPGGVVFHVLNRGNERRALFRKPGDYETLLGVLAETLERVAVDHASKQPNPSEAELSRVETRTLINVRIPFSGPALNVRDRQRAEYQSWRTTLDRALQRIERDPAWGTLHNLELQLQKLDVITERLQDGRAPAE